MVVVVVVVVFLLFFFLLSAWQAGLAINRVSTLSRVVFNVREKGERERGGMKTNMADPNQKRRKKKQKANNKKKKEKGDLLQRPTARREKKKRGKGNRNCVEKTTVTRSISYHFFPLFSLFFFFIYYYIYLFTLSYRISSSLSIQKQICRIRHVPA